MGSKLIGAIIPTNYCTAYPSAKYRSFLIDNLFIFNILDIYLKIKPNNSTLYAGAMLDLQTLVHNLFLTFDFESKISYSFPYLEQSDLILKNIHLCRISMVGPFSFLQYCFYSNF